MQQEMKRLSKKTLFSRKNDIQSVVNRDRRRTEIGLRQCDIRRSCSSNRQKLNLISATVAVYHMQNF